MEEKALETLRIMLGRRKLETATERIETDKIKKMEKVTVYTIGSVLVCFSQKDKVLAGDITNILAFAEENGHTNGIIIIERHLHLPHNIDSMHFFLLRPNDE